MFTISTCPRCQKQVSIPAGIDSAALVRCPLCDAEYPLSEAIPPELIPVLAATGENLFTTIEPGEIRIEKEEEDNEAAAVARRAPIAAVRVRRRAPKSALQTIIEIVTGGVAGCLVAYYGLAIYFGPQFKTVGLPNLPLPFIAWLTAAPDTVDGVEAKPAGVDATSSALIA